MWISSIVILFGAELNSEIEHQTVRDSTVEREKPLGARGAVMADTVGLPVVGTIANDYASVIRAIDRGQLLAQSAPRALVTKDIEGLAALVRRESPAPAVQKAKPSLLKRLLSVRPTHAAQ